MNKLITKIGKGQRGVKDLTWSEAKQALRSLIEEQATPLQAGAFLMAMRIKLEAVPELVAFTATAREYVSPLELPAGLNVVDLPTYGEKHDTFHACIAASILAASAGAPVLMHGVESPAVPSDAPRVLAQLGIPTDRQSQGLAEVLRETNFAYLDLALYHPPLARFLGLRQEMGVQNLFHQVARLLNPARASSQVIGIAHPPYLEKMAEATSMFGGGRLLILQGIEGYPELSISMGTMMRELRKGRVFPLNIKPKDVGLPSGSFQAMSLPSSPSTTSIPEQEAAWIRKILTNQIRGSSRDWVVFNAAMLLYAAGMVSSLGAGVPLAQRCLETGAAGRKLAQLSAGGRSMSTHVAQREVVHT